MVIKMQEKGFSFSSLPPPTSPPFSFNWNGYKTSPWILIAGCWSNFNFEIKNVAFLLSIVLKICFSTLVVVIEE